MISPYWTGLRALQSAPIPLPARSHTSIYNVYVYFVFVTRATSFASSRLTFFLFLLLIFPFRTSCNYPVFCALSSVILLFVFIPLPFLYATLNYFFTPLNFHDTFLMKFSNSNFGFNSLLICIAHECYFFLQFCSTTMTTTMKKKEKTLLLFLLALNICFALTHIVYFPYNFCSGWTVKLKIYPKKLHPSYQRPNSYIDMETNLSFSVLNKKIQNCTLAITIK